MENKEAIEMLERFQNPEPWEPQITSRAYEALEMAIAALQKQETAKHECEDCSKQAYTDTLRMDVYQKGLSDAWEAAKKICDMKWKKRREVFGTDVYADIIALLSASECIEKIRQYEQGEEEQIQVGNEIKAGNDRYIVLQTYLNNIDEPMAVLFNKRDGNICQWHLYNANGAIFEKTGRHFPEIAEVLQKMKEK